MSEIIRGTTPTNVFNVNVDLRDVEDILITYSQKGKPVINKTISDVDITENSVTVTLTQTETLKLDHVYDVQIQIRALFDDGTAIASDIISVDVGAILYEGVI